MPALSKNFARELTEAESAEVAFSDVAGISGSSCRGIVVGNGILSVVDT
jgi:hypothetical protein